MSRVLVVLATGFEEIEAVTVIDILGRAEIEVDVAGLNEKEIIGSHNICIISDIELLNTKKEEYDFLVLPGGQPGTDNLKNSQVVIEWINHFKTAGKFICAICAAPTVLQKANVLNHINITSYPSEKENFDSNSYSDENVIQDNNIITSRGVGTAIDFGLKLVETIKGKSQRDKLAAKILWK